MDASIDHVKFVRQLYSTTFAPSWKGKRKLLEDTAAKVRQLINEIEKRNKEPMKTVHYKDTNNTQGNKRPHLSSDMMISMIEARAKQTADLGAHGYEVEPRDFVNYMESLSTFRCAATPFYLCAVLTIGLQMPPQVSDLHRISAVGPEQEINREERSR